LVRASALHAPTYAQNQQKAARTPNLASNYCPTPDAHPRTFAEKGTCFVKYSRGTK
jgi:hypothetical protein